MGAGSYVENLVIDLARVTLRTYDIQLGCRAEQCRAPGMEGRWAEAWKSPTLVESTGNACRCTGHMTRVPLGFKVAGTPGDM